MAFTLWAQICWLPSSDTPQRGSDICLRVAPSSSPVTGSLDNHWKLLQEEEEMFAWCSCWTGFSARSQRPYHLKYFEANQKYIGKWQEKKAFQSLSVTVQSVYGPEGEVPKIPDGFLDGSGRVQERFPSAEVRVCFTALTFSPRPCNSPFPLMSTTSYLWLATCRGKHVISTSILAPQNAPVIL